MFEPRAFDPDLYEEKHQQSQDKAEDDDDAHLSETDRLRSLHLKLTNTIRWRYKQQQQQSSDLKTNLVSEWKVGQFKSSFIYCVFFVEKG